MTSLFRRSILVGLPSVFFVNYGLAIAKDNSNNSQINVNGLDKQKRTLFWMSRVDLESATRLVEQLTHLLDEALTTQSNLSLIYDKSSASHKERFRREDFISRLTRERLSLGVAVERVAAGVDGGYLTMPNFPDAEYCIVSWNVKFKSQGIFTEQFVMGRARGTTQWIFTNYYIGLKQIAA